MSYRGGYNNNRGRGGRDDNRGGDGSRGRFRERSEMGDDRSFRGGRGDRGDRRGGFRGRGDGGGGATPDVCLVNDHMFSQVPTEVSLQENSIIPECGERYGSEGTVTQLCSNYFRVQSKSNRAIHQYLVTFDKEINSPKMQYFLIRSVPELSSAQFAFDGSSLFLPFKIEDKMQKVTSNRGEEITVSIRYTTQVGFGSPSYTTVINVILRKVMKMLKLTVVKRHHFDQTEAKQIREHGLEVWPGISGTLNFFNGYPLYCVDTLSHVMRRENCYDFLSKLAGAGETSREEISRKLIGQIVMTRYNNRTYRIDSVEWGKNPESKFTLKDGTEISYIEYYRKHYEIDIRDKDQPLFGSILKERRLKHEKRAAIQRGEEFQPSETIVHLIPELCTITGITDDVRSNFAVMKDLAAFTKLSPSARCNGVYNFLDRVSRCESATEYLDSWGVEFDKHLISIPARQFKVEKIFLRSEQESFTPSQDNVDWTNAFRSGRMTNPGSLERWAIIVSNRDRRLADDFLNTLGQACQALDYPVQPPTVYELRSANTTEYIRGFKDVVRNDPNLQMVMFVIPQNRKEIYDSIKISACIEQPIPTQVVTTKTLSRQNAIRSVATKVAIQMSVKRGGEPWIVNIPVKKRMVVGIDVCHDTGSSKNSWMGFVASTNDSFTRYYSRATKQPARTEIADSLFENMKLALHTYIKENGYPPISIYIYRDGVGDGQINVVKTHELPSIQKAIREVCPTDTPTLALIIVRKRINTRLFNPGQMHATNPLPGSIVDRVITKEDYPNFYLVSQCVREGTVNPTHYIVLYNDSNLITTRIQVLTYKLCHLYFNWMGTVRVPSPCQYAHKLCFLVSQSLRSPPSSALSNILYYL